jgi:dihydroneopterin aldolase/2-amino-4-hydroxy-6-hydroxymethyldihydropteridine diphosphokinase
MDRIHVNGLRVMAVIGTLPHEREAAQPLQIDLILEADLRDAGRSDELADTANYGAVADEVAALVRESKDLLLERLAHRIAETVLRFDQVAATRVTVTKLRPPVAEDIASTAVTIHRSRVEMNVPHRSTHRAIVALGSNLGPREEFLRYAIEHLGAVVAQSQVFETDPVGGPDGQGAYLNMVVVVETPLDPYAFIRRCQYVEATAGRQRLVHWGPRTLDVDLLFFDDVTIDDPDLTVPHPRYAERRFVLAPLEEVAPERCPAGWDATLAPLAVHARGPLGTR